MFEKLDFETATYTPFCTMSWHILFLTASITHKNRKSKKVVLIDLYFTAFINKRNHGGTYWSLAGLDKVNVEDLFEIHDSFCIYNIFRHPVH